MKHNAELVQFRLRRARQTGTRDKDSNRNEFRRNVPGGDREEWGQQKKPLATGAGP